MARTSKKQKLTDYKDCLDSAKAWRKNQSLDENWRRFNDLYRGNDVHR